VRLLRLLRLLLRLLRLLLKRVLRLGHIFLKLALHKSSEQAGGVSASRSGSVYHTGLLILSMPNERLAVELVRLLGLGWSGLRRCLLSTLATAKLEDVQQARCAFLVSIVGPGRKTWGMMGREHSAGWWGRSSRRQVACIILKGRRIVALVILIGSLTVVGIELGHWRLLVLLISDDCWILILIVARMLRMLRVLRMMGLLSLELGQK
jgi:hypothetical protein